MSRNLNWTVAASALFAAFSSLAGPFAQANPYPMKPVRIINPTPVGNGPDVIGRIVSDRLSKKWGQQVVTVNRPGAGGLLAAQAAVAAEHDGYTLYQANSSSVIALPVTQKLSFDFARDFVPLGLVGENPFVLAVSPTLGAKSVSELIALAKKQPGGILYTGAVRGSLPHLTGELFRARAGVDFTFVPYASVAQAMGDIMGGRISMLITGLAGLAGALERGAVTPIAVTSSRRLPGMPDLPTVAEVLPGFVATGWFVLLAPAGTPEAIVKQVSGDLRRTLELPEVQKKLEALGTFTHLMSRAETAQFMRAEQQMWQPVIRQLDLK